MIILWNSSRNYSNRICKRRSQWLSLTLKDHNSTLLLVLMFAGTINWCLWVIVEVCGNVSAVRQDLWEDPSWFKWFKMFAWKTWEVFSRASHLGYILNFPRLRWQLTPQACSGGPWAPDFTTTCSSAKGSSATPWRSYLLTSYEQDTVKLLWSSAQASQFSPKNSKHHTTVSKPFPTWIYCCLHLYLRSVTLGREGAYNLCSGAISEIRARKSRLSPRCTVLAEPVKASKGPIRLNMFFSKETFDMVAKDD